MIIIDSKKIMELVENYKKNCKPLIEDMGEYEIEIKNNYLYVIIDGYVLDCQIIDDKFDFNYFHNHLSEVIKNLLDFHYKRIEFLKKISISMISMSVNEKLEH